MLFEFLDGVVVDRVRYLESGKPRSFRLSVSSNASLSDERDDHGGVGERDAGDQQYAEREQ